MIIQNNEQWKHQGYCVLCRKQKYCKKVCAAHRRYMDAKLMDYIENKTVAGKIMKAINGEYTNERSEED